MEKTFIVGSYTTPDNAKIRRIAVDCEKAAIRELAPVEDIGNPIYFAVSEARDRLYVAQATAPDADRAKSGALAAYALDADLNARRIDLIPFPFSVPCHISLSHDGTRLLFAEYSAAHAGVVAINKDGTFGACSVVHHEGHGPNQKRQESAHCHCAVASPDDRVLFICDLGTDTVNAYDLAGCAGGGTLAPLPENDFHGAPGLGPRHMIFNAAGNRAYLIYELGSAVQSFAYENGQLRPLQEPLSTLPQGFGGDSKCAAIRISPCGRWLLASNRGHDSIAAFPIKDDGTLGAEKVISQLTGRFPRDFVFASQDCVIVGHKLSDEVALYRFDGATGALTRLPATFAMPKPLAFVR